MGEFDSLAEAVTEAGREIFWLGPASEEQVARVEALFGVSLPESFRRFLKSYGGGGVIGAEVSGIEDDDAELDNGGTLLGDTKVCRERHQLPPNLIVIYFQDGEVCWCLDTSKNVEGEYPVVSYNVFTKEVDRNIAADFSSFMRHHLSLYTEAS